MSKPRVYAPPIEQTNSSVMDGNGNAKNGGKFKARYPHTPLGVGTSNPSTGKGFRPAKTPGGPAGS
jgi:hypothetical protein